MEPSMSSEEHQYMPWPDEPFRATPRTDRQPLPSHFVWLRDPAHLFEGLDTAPLPRPSWAAYTGLDHPDTEGCVIVYYGAVPPDGDPEWPVKEWPHPSGGTCALRVIYYSMHLVGIDGFIMSCPLLPGPSRGAAFNNLKWPEARRILRALTVWKSVVRGKKPRGPKAALSPDDVLWEWESQIAKQLHSNGDDPNDLDRDEIAKHVGISPDRLSHRMWELGIKNADVISRVERRLRVLRNKNFDSP
jgi:hypothetical protein